jgi:hypothetical protein
LLRHPAKLAILATIAFHTSARADDVYREGIRRIIPQDIAFARDLGFAVKMLAIARDCDGRVEAHVHLVFLPLNHPLAGIRDELNALFVRGDFADLIDATRNRRTGARPHRVECVRGPTDPADRGNSGVVLSPDARLPTGLVCSHRSPRSSARRA